MKKTSVQSNINLETLAGGAFAEKLNEALMQVAENIQNPNTEATTKRQIQITLKFAPNKTRQLVSTQIAVTTKLAATEAIDTQMIMGVNMRTGQIEIAEYLNLNRNVYWRYEKGEREIPVWALIKLADYYRVSTDYLLGLTDDPARR